MTMTEAVEIGIIGGTGIYDQESFEDIKEIKIFTPFGHTSDLVSVGAYKDIKVAFIPRHGKNHTIPPHRINYRANVWALKQLGVKRVCCASTGNMGASVAAYCARAGIRCRIFLSGTACKNKLKQIKAHGAEIVQVQGDYMEALEK